MKSADYIVLMVKVEPVVQVKLDKLNNIELYCETEINVEKLRKCESQDNHSQCRIWYIKDN
jgi:hypothetical protein